MRQASSKAQDTATSPCDAQTTAGDLLASPVQMRILNRESAGTAQDGLIGKGPRRAAPLAGTVTDRMPALPLLANPLLASPTLPARVFHCLPTNPQRSGSSMSTNNIVHIKTSPAQPPLSAAQNKFNSLVKKIEAQKKSLSEWQAALEYCQTEAVKKLHPLNQTFTEHQTAMVHLLDQQLMKHKFSRLQLDKLIFMIVQTCGQLLEKNDDDEIKIIYNKYTNLDYDEEKEDAEFLATESMKSMLEQEFGISLGDEDIDLENPHATAERLFEKLRQRETEEAAATAASHAERRRTARQQAKEAKAAEETANVSKSVQAVYRQLASALHPDREQDPTERERKTKLMQQVTVAYSNKDLLKLLELQLVVEQIDENKLSSLSAEHLKHYNKVLSDQLSELKEEAMLKKAQIRVMLRLPEHERLTPKRLVALIKQDIETAQLEIFHIKSDLRQFQDIKQLKEWLNRFKLPEPDPDFDQFLIDFPTFR